jgi:hypothetical protein
MRQFSLFHQPILFNLYNFTYSLFFISINTLICNASNKGDLESLRKAYFFLLDAMDRNYIELCLEIVKRTDDEKVLNKIEILLYSAGVVNGDDCITRVYEERAEQLRPHLSDENERLQNLK